MLSVAGIGVSVNATGPQARCCRRPNSFAPASPSPRARTQFHVVLLETRHCIRATTCTSSCRCELDAVDFSQEIGAADGEAPPDSILRACCLGDWA